MQQLHKCALQLFHGACFHTVPVSSTPCICLHVCAAEVHQLDLSQVAAVVWLVILQEMLL